ncbi:MAG: DEAD/DEAH box helicase [Chloroflexi bacterium]|nr:DEAD/DEAH box helicase [Chloroflexota bacterium]MCY3696409.1 DEAD/DEAH box helicase [Chloroflexota bacterium]
MSQTAVQPSVLDHFHPLVRDWFVGRFGAPTFAQEDGWPAIRTGEDCLIAAPTGSGKTLTAFLAGIDELIREGDSMTDGGELPDEVRILYVSPLKALSNDIRRNLEEPLTEIRQLAQERGVELPRIRMGLRTGDTTQAERQAIVKRPPQILITTPESLYLMLTAKRSREILRTVRTVILDEIHAVVRDKRGSHLSLTLARLDHVADRRPTRIGLSATQKPMEEIAAFLTGLDLAGKPLPCRILDLGHRRELKLWIETTDAPLQALATHDHWGAVYDRLAELILQHRTTLIFVNRRSLAERVAHELGIRVGKEHVSGHHGSLSKERRHVMEQRLKAGDLKAVVATASLELGIDIGSVDLVCQVGSPRRIATFLQRVGRSGHALGLVPHGALFPTALDELVECAAMVRAVERGDLDRICQPKAPIEILAQQIVAESAAEEEWREDELFRLMKRAAPYAELERSAFDETVEMLATGIGEAGGRSQPLVHRDRINGVVRPRRAARMTAILNGGTIPETGDYRVIKEPEGAFIGTVNEDFAIETAAGDIFLLGSTSWRIRRVENKGIVRVEDAHGAPPTIPFWLGEAPGRSMELSAAVGELRRDVGRVADDVEGAVRTLQRECHMQAIAAEQIVEYLSETQDSLQVMPSDTDVVFERFFDEAGGQQLVVHAPFGSGVNRAWGLALRKRFCVRFDFELQAAANEEGILLSLGPTQSFPLEEAFEYLKADNAEQSLRQAVLYAPFWNTRWRWAATRALAVPRRRAGKEVPPYLQRMIADDLLAAVFPAQVGCQENLAGPLEVPDHPLIAQTMDDCLREAVDTDALIGVLERIERGEVRLHARDTVTPSAMAQSIININPFGFLDDAPLEERRARAVMTRRTLPNEQRDLGKLDIDAIERVQDEAFPPIRDADELHELLHSVVAWRESARALWREGALPALDPAMLAELRESGRAARATRPDDADGAVWFAAEHLESIRQLFPDHAVEPGFSVPESALALPDDREDARLKLVRGHLEISGPITPEQLSARCGLAASDCGYGLTQLEAYGEVMRGHFTPTLAEADEEEYCDRRLLARIHRYTIARLRAEIEPVTVQHYLRFLLRWQHLTPDNRLSGKAGVRAVVEQLQGFEAPAASWERDLIAARVSDYREAWLDELCLAGDIAWARLTTRSARRAPTKTTPVALTLRRDFRSLLAAVRRPAPIPAARGRSAPEPQPDVAEQMHADGGAASQILRMLNERGALFFDELVDGTRRIATDVESGLRELVASGLAHADGFQGLRQLIRPNRRSRRPRYGGGGVFIGEGPAGRWAALPPSIPATTDPEEADELAERIARILLHRYGVVSRELATRESLTIQWRDILRALRRLEARGEIRGGRFIQGLIGEQFALPEAIDRLRAVRRSAETGERVTIATSDPCNLVGILLPGQKVPSRLGSKLTLIDGVPEEEALLGAVAAD